MKKIVQVFSVLALIVSLTTSLSAQIVVDGDNSDWDSVPVLVSAPDNVEGVVPGGLFSDRVDVKELKAKIEGNVLYALITFHGGQVWPNEAYYDDAEAKYRHRGYYHLILDLDNDASTGWDNTWYEGSKTTLGYYIDNGMHGLTADDAMGAEMIVAFGVKGNWSNPGEYYGPISKITYNLGDVSASADSGAVEWDDIVDFRIPGIVDSIFNPRDSARAVSWSGSVASDAASTAFALASHAWNDTTNTLELGFEITAAKEYFSAQGYLAEGSTIGVAAVIETPIDDWGTDFTASGNITVDSKLERPSTFIMDGDNSDWADVPVLISAPDNVEGVIPTEVGAATTNNVDIKDVKVAYSSKDDMFYFNMQFQGTDDAGHGAWPNWADYDEVTGRLRHRGYYKFLFDLDNDASTGFPTFHYEGHLTPAGWYDSTGTIAMTEIGAELVLEASFKTEKSEELGYGPYWTDPINKNLGFWAGDLSGLGGYADILEYNHYRRSDTHAPIDSLATHVFNGLVSDEVPEKPTLQFAGHGFGEDFLEFAIPAAPIRDFYAALGKDWLTEGQTISIAAMTETPQDDWGVDLTTGATFDIVTAVESKEYTIPNKYTLDQNYPNPFNPSTLINYSIPENGNIKLVIYNMLGQKVKTLINTNASAGTYSASWNGRNDAGQLVTSGIYIYQLEAGLTKMSKKMMLLK